MLLDPQQLQNQLLQVIEPLYLVVVIEFHVKSWNNHFGNDWKSFSLNLEMALEMFTG